VCWKPCSSCWSFHLLREEFLAAPIHSPPLWFAVSVLQSWLPSILSKSIYGGTQKTKLSLLNNYGYKPLKGEFGSLQIFFIGRMPDNHNLLSLDASLAIPMRVLHFKASRRQRPGRSDRPPGRLDRPGWPHHFVESSALVL
jgi:hypothetical protein